MAIEYSEPNPLLAISLDHTTPLVQPSHYKCVSCLCRFADKYSFGKRAPTSYQGNKGAGELYLLETLVFWVQWEQQHPGQGVANYIQAARKQQAGIVTIADRQVSIINCRGLSALCCSYPLLHLQCRMEALCFHRT